MQVAPDPAQQGPRPPSPASFATVFAVIVLMFNLFFLVTAIADANYLALAILFAIWPIANLLLAVFGSVFLLIRRGPGFAILVPMILVWVLLTAGIVLDWCAIFLIPTTARGS